METDPKGRGFPAMTIGQVAANATVNIQTIRYYERRGLIPAPPRTPSGYRQYTEVAVARIRFIKRAQALGFSLSEIRDLLALRVRRMSDCVTVERKAQSKIALMEHKIRELNRMKRGLEWVIVASHSREPTGTT